MSEKWDEQAAIPVPIDDVLQENNVGKCPMKESFPTHMTSKFGNKTPLTKAFRM